MAYYALTRTLKKSLREKLNGKLLLEPSLLKKGVGTIALYIHAPNSCHCLSQTPTFHESTRQCFESATEPHLFYTVLESLLIFVSAHVTGQRRKCNFCGAKIHNF